MAYGGYTTAEVWEALLYNTDSDPSNLPGHINWLDEEITKNQAEVASLEHELNEVNQSCPCMYGPDHELHYLCVKDPASVSGRTACEAIPEIEDTISLDITSLHLASMALEHHQAGNPYPQDAPTTLPPAIPEPPAPPAPPAPEPKESKHQTQTKEKVKKVVRDSPPYSPPDPSWKPEHIAAIIASLVGVGAVIWLMKS
jgi:hypothetical protein